MYDEPALPTAPATDTPAEPSPLSETQRRFTTCRWHKPAESGQPAHCTHREVLPMAGVHGFSADAWCPDCSLYKLRRVPRKHTFS
jgi:hypothetical protein